MLLSGLIKKKSKFKVNCQSSATMSETIQMRGNDYKLSKTKSNTELPKNFFINRVIDTWKSLSNSADSTKYQLFQKQDLTNSGRTTHLTSQRATTTPTQTDDKIYQRHPQKPMVYLRH